MRNIEKKCLQGLKRQINCLQTLFKTSDQLLINISSKTEIKTKSNKFLL